MKTTTQQTAPGDPVQLTRAGLAEHFEVTLSTVSQWIVRRERNGFPEPVDVTIAPLRRGSRVVETWNLDEVVQWRQSYHAQSGRKPRTL